MAPIIISFVSQKGGVSKSTLARLVAREYANDPAASRRLDPDPAEPVRSGWPLRVCRFGDLAECKMQRERKWLQLTEGNWGCPHPYSPPVLLVCREPFRVKDR